MTAEGPAPPLMPIPPALSRVGEEDYSQYPKSSAARSGTTSFDHGCRLLHLPLCLMKLLLLHLHRLLLHLHWCLRAAYVPPAAAGSEPCSAYDARTRTIHTVQKD